MKPKDRLKELREEFMEFISQECSDLKLYKAGKYDGKIWRWIIKRFEPKEVK